MRMFLFVKMAVSMEISRIYDISIVLSVFLKSIISWFGDLTKKPPVMLDRPMLPDSPTIYRIFGITRIFRGGLGGW